VGLLKLVVSLAHTHILSHDLPSTPYLLPDVWKRKRDRKRKRRERKKEIGEIPGFQLSCFSFHFEPWLSRTGPLPPWH
jgi:hypothetical protein